MPEPTRQDPAKRDPIAARSPFLVGMFCMYADWLLRRRFHAFRLRRLPAVPEGRPVIVFTNHPSWWDPIVFHLLQQRCFPEGAGFGPMEAAAVARYGVFDRLGIFGIEPGARGAARFLDVAARVLRDARNVLWVTAEGAFTDARTRPVRLRPGIAHLARRVPNAVLLPLALEYPFWNESKPEALAQFGTPLTADPALSVAEWTSRLERALSETMDSLADAAVSRDPARFVALTQGAVGVGGPYDLYRRLRAAWSGRAFDPGHEGRGA